MRKKIIAGNWKMNNDQRETAELIAALKSIRFSTETRVMIAPAFTHLQQAVALTEGTRLEVLAQNAQCIFFSAHTVLFSATTPEGKN